MKILWIAYQPIPIIMGQLNPGNNVVTGGWLQGSADIISSHKEIELSYCFPYGKICEGTAGNIRYYTIGKIPELHFKDRKSYRKEDFERFKYIVESCKPDVIHIFGSETMFQRQFVQMSFDFSLIDRTIVWIQGLTEFYSYCYTYGLSVKQIRRKTLWELLRGTNIEGIQKRLALNGMGENRMLKLLKNVFVRTEWDSACCKSVNPELKMYWCNETLRPVFYEDKIWKLENKKKHTIFMSQSNTPIKGYHQLLKALPIILREFPDTVVYTTGSDLFRTKSMVEKIRDSSYEKILRKEIVDHNLREHVKFLGTLKAEEMRNQYLDTHIFVSASSIENSPNSVGEAMILGVPIVASDVGGVSSMLTHEKEGLLYPYNEYAVLAEDICQIFRDDELAIRLSNEARKRALHTHNQENNYQVLIQNYRSIIGLGENSNESI